ncbi:MAG: hypothetical protein LBQ46_13855 [Treponema sp.]|jgi:hypothetical protein|nr:hypothetical protein [Treponema sp.]
MHRVGLLLVCCLLPLAAFAQTEEWVETGRFGAEEPVLNEAPAGFNGLRDRWLYLGFRVGPSLRFYTPSGDTPYTGGDTHAPSLDTALQANVRILSFLSFQAEAVFTWDSASIWAYRPGSNNEIDRYTWDYSAYSLQFPLTLHLNFYPRRFRVSPFLGTYLLVSLGDLEVGNSLGGGKEAYAQRFSLPLGLVGGLNAAMKLGPGMIFTDLRYAADLGRLKIDDQNIQEYRRSMVSFTLGYEFGLFTKKRVNR